MKYIFMLLALMTVAGCTATSAPIKQTKRGIHISCSGLSSSWEKCYEQAVSVCESSQYRVIAKSGDVVEDPGDYPFGINPAGYTSRSMIIICKKPRL
ncbi:hypothetical protein RRX38_00325 [Pseudomonas sp. DTU_2021_1001937_2_SI_NGA_ILE_001]|uniref:hypothetical protein n=1 Tax=Pseudomonas sp. DTU_2021_1001937_2_SI_NGA_ILE_001 TaxID=3077589 RepID=UPI0025E18A72|nr:hypothetical protein [Pseudomonas sp. DTU_2021_1001937_2_SI_NGA_ILE_001]WNW09658.1 hypothetical protein RRX38_00325 [Pseudomonas sp. DTU_2021_1001937_2_SI_NGA_ILE_001]